MKRTKRTGLLWAAGMLPLAFIFGCKTPEVVEPPPLADMTAEIDDKFKEEDYDPPNAGMPTAPRPYTISQMVDGSGLSFSARTNPFGLFGEEMAFETGIRYRIILSKIPGFALELPPPVDIEPEELDPLEPQPYRRISGIYFGDTVSAILEVEGDSEHYIVSPGSQIGDTEWIVESISSETVILRRGRGKKPDRVIVNLESMPFGLPGGGG